ncbi:MAG: class I SAM-dependent methyltransferase [Deltaproteobacteria bacterium]|nr:class I SAM-dependent methyltransferase [Deltaproteobacteria bacterium]
MIDGRPSMTARAVAAVRAKLERPSAPSGDPESELRLYQSLIAEIPPDAPRERVRELATMIAIRTRFFDQAVLDALANHVNQIVILAAGYDGRALRFRTPGVRFFEVDFPATQADKRARLASVNARTDDIAFITADLTQPGLEAALAHAGHDARAPTQWLCEGLLRYLPEDAVRSLFARTASLSAPGSVFSASIAARVPGWEDPNPARRAERAEELERIGEPVLTVVPPEVAKAWLEAAGWQVERMADMAAEAPGMRPGTMIATAIR